MRHFTSLLRWGMGAQLGLLTLLVGGCGPRSLRGANINDPAPTAILGSKALTRHQSIVWNELAVQQSAYMKREGPGNRGPCFGILSMRLNFLPPTGVTLSRQQVLDLLGPPEYTEGVSGQAEALYYGYRTGQPERLVATVFLRGGRMSAAGVNHMPDPVPKEWSRFAPKKGMEASGATLPGEGSRSRHEGPPASDGNAGVGIDGHREPAVANPDPGTNNP